MGAYVDQFERALAALVGAKDRHVVAVSTGHAALHLSLILAGVRGGDEVITPAFNNITDFQAIIATGAEPVFCDIDAGSLCIDLAKAESLVSERTKAVIVMDYDCILCDHDAVASFADRHHLRVIHDAAHVLGSRYRGQPVGSFSDMCIFSFDPVKTITCIDGGAIVVKTEAERDALHEMRLVGMGQSAAVMYQNQRAWTYDVKRLGFRYHMANLHAALGLAQLAKFERIASTRRETCRFYNERLADLAEVKIPRSRFDGDITPFLYYVRVPAESRDELRAHLKARGIDTGIHWQPGHWFTLFRHCRRGDLPVTERVGHEILSLPLHSCMPRADAERVVDGIRGFFLGARA
jgi:dTDP-4-amino-4,6-dideoxygalactose transaminase